MATAASTEPLGRSIRVAGRGVGAIAFLDFGPTTRPVDLVFLHANGFNALTYRQILAPLATRYRILAVDQRGHGDTSLEATASGRRSWLDLRDDLLAFLAALDLTEVVLAGHSMGGTTSLLAAAFAPARCRRLTLLDPVILPRGHGEVVEDSPMVQAAKRRRAVFPNRAAAIAAYKGRGAFRTWPDAMLADYVAAGFHDTSNGEVTLACTPAWEASGFASQDHDSLDAFRRSTCPIDVLRAESNSTFYVDDVASIADDRIHITNVPGSTHFLPMEFPDLVRSTLTRAMDSSTLSDACAQRVAN
jgi:pimeloyl-ACP methyl ester carboxylesterase